MELSGSTIVAHPRPMIWDALYDAETIRRSISGCTELEWVSDSELKGEIKKKFGPIKSTFPIQLEVKDIVQYESYTMLGTSKASSFGYVNGEVQFRLVDIEDGCELFYDANISMGGKVAQIGSRLMNSAAKKIVGDFFATFFENLSVESKEGVSEEPDDRV